MTSPCPDCRESASGVCTMHNGSVPPPDERQAGLRAALDTLDAFIYPTGPAPSASEIGAAKALQSLRDAAFAAGRAAALGPDSDGEVLRHGGIAAIWLVEQYIEQRPVLSGTVPPSREQALSALETARAVLAALAVVWLIERGQPEGLYWPEWWSVTEPRTGAYGFTRDAGAAVRYPSKEAAEAVITRFDLLNHPFRARAVQHGFIGVVAQVPAEERLDVERLRQAMENIGMLRTARAYAERIAAEYRALATPSAQDEKGLKK